MGSRHAQQGAVLVLSLILLALLIILSVGAQRSLVTGTQQSGNFSDRELAFQIAEITLGEGVQFVDSLSGLLADEQGIVLDCTHPDNDCLPVPDRAGVLDVANATTIAWRNIDSATALPSLAAGTPQYFVERVSETIDSGLQAGGRDSASFSYGEEVTGSVNYAFYRITARNFDPAGDGVAGRALVQLQAIVRRPY